jgi:phytoene dehydrogenase-like protein
VKYDTIIIGAGMSGLAAGVRLAHFGKRVCLLERHRVIGGLSSFYQRGGHRIDVGLHAITNYTSKNVRGGPLGRMLRQLRLAWDELALAPQLGSAIRFPDAELRFTNDIAVLESEVRRRFPDQIDRFRRLIGRLCGYDQIGQPETRHSARACVGEILSDPLLVEMLFCPLLFYGSAREHDFDFGQFSVLFRSIFLEGLGRPLSGIRLILKKLSEKFTALGGILRLRAGVSRLVVREDRVVGVMLEDGSELETDNVLSSAGWLETMRLCAPDGQMPAEDPDRMSIVEAISVLNAPPQQLGIGQTIIFYNDSSRFYYARPEGLVDPRSGVICAPNNFDYGEPLPENLLRITALASYDRWAELDPERYRQAKHREYDRLAAAAVRFIPEFRPAVIATDVFTPLTIRRFTGHEGGAPYGSAAKRYDGATPLRNLFLCGNDQGMVGIVGTLLSGISIANRYLLRDE